MIQNSKLPLGVSLGWANGTVRPARYWRRLLAALLLAVWIFDLGLGTLPTSGATQDPPHPQGRFYPQTRHTLDSNFISFYDKHGGVLLLGYPITEARQEGGYLVQWTERERLEWHPEYRGSDAEVLLGLLGHELTRFYQGPHFTQGQGSTVKGKGEGTGPGKTPPAGAHTPGAGPDLGSQFFPETGQSVAEPFLSYWRSNGALPVFGYPISTLYEDERGIQVQWFERARFEMHPELPEQYRVSLGLLGVESMTQTGMETTEVEVVNSPVPGIPLEIGLAQGGESGSTNFFDNVRQAGAVLGPGVVRLDNIYNFYHIVSRDEQGELHFNWSELDKVIDAVRAMNKEPLICLSYMPETMSRSGTSRVEPPRSYDEWAALVRATVAHLNVERKLGVRYWEVWNEPNLWDFWHGSFKEYLHLYDVSAQAALAVDPTIHIGGPAFSSFEPGGLGEFMQHEGSAECGVESAECVGRVDFVSWHAYGLSADVLAEQIRKVRAIRDQFPQLHPEMFVTEFNVLQGGRGDTSIDGLTDKVEGAISFLRSVEAMQRERLDRAFLFELKDGAGPRNFWGRWGVLTNDGEAKPIYYALKAYQNRPGGRLPVVVRRGQTDGSVGVLAYGGTGGSTVMVWYTGAEAERVKVALPKEWAGAEFSVAVFDGTHNNPARSGDGTLRMSAPCSGGDLVFEVQPDSLLILSSDGQ